MTRERHTCWTHTVPTWAQISPSADMLSETVWNVPSMAGSLEARMEKSPRYPMLIKVSIHPPGTRTMEVTSQIRDVDLVVL